MPDRRAVIVLFAVLACGACSPYQTVTPQAMQALRPGMTPLEVPGALVANPDPVLTFEIDGEPWTVQCYWEPKVLEKNRFDAAFDAGGLRYWGTPGSFADHPDAQIVAVGRETAKLFAAWRELKDVEDSQREEYDP